MTDDPKGPLQPSIERRNRRTVPRPHGLMVVMAGLPATGKTSIAFGIARASDAVVLSKDEIRAACFPAKVIDYSAAQDDLCMEMLYSAARYIFAEWPDARIVVDGRTFTQRKHVERVMAVAEGIGTQLRFVECTCDDATARKRLDDSARRQSHVAANRDWQLFEALRSKAEPLEVERITVDTSGLTVQEATDVCVRHLFG